MVPGGPRLYRAGPGKAGLRKTNWHIKACELELPTAAALTCYHTAQRGDRTQAVMEEDAEPEISGAQHRSLLSSPSTQLYLLLITLK